MNYRVTAIIEDNREQTVKVCTECDTSWDATDALIEEICRVQRTTPQTVLETWAILFMSVIRIEE